MHEFLWSLDISKDVVFEIFWIFYIWRLSVTWGKHFNKMWLHVMITESFYDKILNNLSNEEQIKRTLNADLNVTQWSWLLAFNRRLSFTKAQAFFFQTKAVPNILNQLNTEKIYENTLNQYCSSLQANICFCLLLSNHKTSNKEKRESSKKLLSWTKKLFVKFMASSINIWIGNSDNWRLIANRNRGGKASKIDSVAKDSIIY